MSRLRQIMITLLSMLMLFGVVSSVARADVSPPSADPVVSTSGISAEEPAQADIAATPCRSTDHFTGSVAWQEHFLNCNHLHYDVYTIKGSTIAPDTDPAKGTGTAMAPDFVPDTDASGGPSCSWQYKHIVEYCLQKGVKHLICMQYWSGTYYPWHCGPAAAYNLTHAESLWTVVKNAFTSHAAQACTKGTLTGGGGTAVVMKAAGSTSGIGILAAAGFGCVAGLINFYWHP